MPCSTLKLKKHFVWVEGMQAAHSGEVAFQRDGCYFLHKEAHYDTDGQTPLALLWKDPACTRSELMQFPPFTLEERGCLTGGPMARRDHNALINSPTSTQDVHKSTDMCFKYRRGKGEACVAAFISMCISLWVSATSCSETGKIRIETI